MTRSASALLSFLVVEGEDDKAFFRRHAIGPRCQPIVAHGKPNVLEVISELDRTTFAGALGIVDADFDHLEGIVYMSPNVIITDEHDLECMILKSAALVHVLHEYGDQDKIASFEKNKNTCVLDHVLALGAPLGALRLHSHRYAWSLRFEDLDYSEFVNPMTMELSIQDLAGAIRSRFGGGGCSPPAAEDLEKAVSRTTLEKPDKWQLCCGHDLTALLGLGLRKSWGTRQPHEVKVELLEKSLRLAFEAQYFARTRLRERIGLWEAATPPFRVL